VEDRTIRVVISTFLVVVPILALTILSGENLASIYLKKGNLRKGLFIGGIAFIIFLVTAIPASEIFGANPVTTDQLVLWAPWIIVFIMFNSLREELWFRGIFLRKYVAHFGEDPGNLLQALLFGAAHLVFPITMLNITGNLILFILPFFIGLASGAAMYKTDSILAAFLIHAGADIPFLIAAFSMI
ncbi:CPBP family intramembrane metalloprotease, partial [Candidatus Thorarchaeota archaeon]